MEIIASHLKRGVEVDSLGHDGTRRPKTYEELNKKIVNASDVKEGDYIYPHELSETKAKWRDKGFTSNLKKSFYNVLKVSKKSLRVEDLVDGEVATVNKEKWHNYGKEISFTKILDKKEIDRQLVMM